MARARLVSVGETQVTKTTMVYNHDQHDCGVYVSSLMAMFRSGNGVLEWDNHFTLQNSQERVYYKPEDGGATSHQACAKRETENVHSTEGSRGERG